MIYLLLRSLTDWLNKVDLYPLFRLLDQTEFRALAAALLSFALVLGFGRRTINWLLRMKIGDAGLTDSAALAAQAASKANTPTMGGLLLIGSLVVSTMLLADISTFYVQAGLIVVILFAAVGASDDWLKLTAKRRGTGARQGLYPWEKLVFQLGLSAIVVYFCSRQDASPLATVLNLPFQRSYEPGSGGVPEPDLVMMPTWLFVILGAMFITGMSNAANITDGMDGLATGISGIVSVGIFVLAFIAAGATAYTLLVPRIEGAGELAVMAGAMAGSCMGFLWWNCNPARVFMGDTGSLALGALIAYIAVVIRQEILIGLMCVIFLVEIGSVILQVGYFKMSGGKRIFRCAPYHHHLHLALWPETQIVARFWVITILCVVLALATIRVR
jgi:phospho-N-acetylmuramoyl-pentapeptide-transferase